MPATKDTFLNHLAKRLAMLDPTRTVMIDGATRPAVLTSENERAEITKSFEECYCVEWGDVTVGRDRRGVQEMKCSISYWTAGAAEMTGVDRGRRLTALDWLLLELLRER